MSMGVSSRHATRHRGVVGFWFCSREGDTCLVELGGVAEHRRVVHAPRVRLLVLGLALPRGGFRVVEAAAHVEPPLQLPVALALLLRDRALARLVRLLREPRGERPVMERQSNARK